MKGEGEGGRGRGLGGEVWWVEGRVVGLGGTADWCMLLGRDGEVRRFAQYGLEVVEDEEACGKMI